jgi:hypothetical protein
MKIKFEFHNSWKYSTCFSLIPDIYIHFGKKYYDESDRLIKTWGIGIDILGFDLFFALYKKL